MHWIVSFLLILDKSCSLSYFLEIKLLYLLLFVVHEVREEHLFGHDLFLEAFIEELSINNQGLYKEYLFLIGKQREFLSLASGR